jgi:4-hydroxybenzoate polyprenyltransferase
MRHYLRLIRLPNVFSVLADAIAGHVLATHVFKAAPAWGTLALSCGASASLYLAGMAFNDIADVREDTRVRPNRPIPSGAVSWRGAIVCACFLMILGIGLAALLSLRSLYFSLGVAAAILLYDFVAKGRFLFGPLALGLCRGLNVLMVISAVAGFDAVVNVPHGSPWFLALVSALYGAGVTAFSANEETGWNRGALATGWVFMAAAFLSVIAFCPYALKPSDSYIFSFVFGGTWILVWQLVRLSMLSSELSKTHSPTAARKLVLAGVQGYCILDAAILVQGGINFPVWPWAVLLILFIFPGRFLRNWLEQKEA